MYVCVLKENADDERRVDREDHRQHATVKHRYERCRQKIEKNQMLRMGNTLEERSNIRDRNDYQKRYDNRCNPIP
jgi:hypothetical protein